MSFIGGLRTLNRTLGSPARFLGPVREVVEPRVRMRKFERDRQARLQKHSGAGFSFEPRSEIAGIEAAAGADLGPRLSHG